MNVFAFEVAETADGVGELKKMLIYFKHVRSFRLVIIIINQHI